MLTVTELDEFDAARLRAVVEGWRHQARRYLEIGEMIAKVTRDRLSTWDGPASAVAKQRVGDILSGFGDTPDRLSGLAGTAEEKIDRLVDCQHRLRDLLGQAAEQQLTVYDNGTVAPRPEPEPAGASVYAHQTPDRWTPRREADELGEKVRDVLREATRIDESFERALPAILEGAAWAPDNPDVLSAEEAAGLLREAADGDQAALKRLKEHQGLFSHQWFATELVTELGPDGVAELPATMGARMDDLVDSGDPDYKQSARDKQVLLGLMADALATATDEGNDAWQPPEQRQRFIDQLKTEGRAEHTVTDDGGETNSYPGYWGVGQIMNAHDGQPPFGTEVLTEVGADLRAFDERMQATDPKWPSSAGPFDNDIANSLSADPTAPGNTSDPMAGLMHAAGSNPDAAADLITDRDGNLDPNLLDRPWGDLGSGYGDAFEAAAKGDDPESTRLAEQIVNTFGTNLTEDSRFGDRYDGARDSLGRLMATHIDDVHSSALPGGSPYTQGFGEAVKFAAQDDTGYKALVDAELAYTSGQIDAALQGGGDVRGNVSGHIDDASVMLGFITEGREAANLGEAEELDKANGLLAKYATAGVGMLPFTDNLSGIAREAADLALRETAKTTTAELLGTDNTAKAEAENASYDQQTRKILTDVTRQVLINNPQLVGENYTIKDYADDDKYQAYPTNTFYDHENQRLRPPEELARNNGAGYDAMAHYMELDPSMGGAFSDLLPWDYESGEEMAQDR